MADETQGLTKRVKELEREVAKLQRKLDRTHETVKGQGARVRSVEGKLETRTKREALVMEALGITHLSKEGDKGFLDDLNDSILRLEEYLLRTSERIDNNLQALNNHREFLVRMNKRVSKVGARERMQMGLSIMKNTLSILAMSGVSFDASLLKDIDDLMGDLDEEGEGLAELQKRKVKLDKKFDGELKKFDLESIWAKKTSLPGYH